jgi:MFS family permease
VHGIACTCAFTGAQTLAILFAPSDRRAAAIGWFGISTILTHAISPLIGEQIIHTWGFDAMFLVAALLSAVAFLLACTLPRPPALASHAGDRDIDPGLARKAVGAASFAMICYGFGFGATQTFVPLLIQRFGLGRVGPFFLTWSLAAVSVRIVFGGAADRYGRRRVIVPAMAMMSLTLVLLAFVRSEFGLVFVGLIFGMAQGLLYPTMNALVADWSKPGNIGRTQSLFSGSYSLGISVCSAMFLVALVITLVGLVTFLRGPKEIGSIEFAEAPSDAEPYGRR